MKKKKKQKKIHEENLRKYDFILLKALIKYVMHKDYDTCFREKVSLIKYVRILVGFFNSPLDGRGKESQHLH